MDAELGAAAFAQRQRAATMIAVNMREQYLVDLFDAHRLGLFDDAVHVRIIAQRDVDNQARLFADDILVGSLQGHDARVIGRELSDKIRCRHSSPFSGRPSAAKN